MWQLLQEFQALISSYIMKYQPPDAAEWRSVIQEVRGVRPLRAAAQHDGRHSTHDTACTGVH